MDINNNNFLMSQALSMAKDAFELGEVPVGAIVVFKNKIISRAHNEIISRLDPTAHAEILAIRRASEKIGNYRLNDAILFTTLEPCAMCYGAIVHARFSRLIFGANDPKTGVCGSSTNLHEQKCFNHIPKITGGVLEEDCSAILKDFFKKRRN